MAQITDFNTLEDDTAYQVDILQTTKLGRTWLRPDADAVTLKGKVIKELGAHVVGNVRAVAD